MAGAAPPGRPHGRSDAEAVAGLHPRRGGDDGARNRREHGDLQRRGRRPAAARAVPGARRSGDVVGDRSEQRNDSRAGLGARLPRLQGPKRRLRVARGPRRRRGEPRGSGRRPGAAGVDGRHRPLPPDGRRGPCRRPGLQRPRVREGRARGCAHQRVALGAGVRARPCGGRPDAAPERTAPRDRRRPARRGRLRRAADPRGRGLLARVRGPRRPRAGGRLGAAQARPRIIAARHPSDHGAGAAGLDRHAGGRPAGGGVDRRGSRACLPVERRPGRVRRAAAPGGVRAGTACAARAAGRRGSGAARGVGERRKPPAGAGRRTAARGRHPKRARRRRRSARPAVLRRRRPVDLRGRGRRHRRRVRRAQGARRHRAGRRPAPVAGLHRPAGARRHAHRVDAGRAGVRAAADDPGAPPRPAGDAEGGGRLAGLPRPRRQPPALRAGRRRGWPWP